MAEQNVCSITDPSASDETLDDASARQSISFNADYEIHSLAKAIRKLLEGDDNEALRGMASRILLLSDIAHESSRLCVGAGEENSLTSLTLAYEGML